MYAPTVPPSAVHIWREVSGGGRPVEYLRWLSAQWEIFFRYGPISGITERDRENFSWWLYARFFYQVC